MKSKIMIIAAALILACCNQQGGVSTDLVKTAVENLKFEVSNDLTSILSKPFSVKIDPNEGGKISLPDGSKIVVCPDAFVDEAGNKITTPVEISYKPLRGVKDIIASGVPMQANNGGKLGQFISDGMFDINASSQGKNVKVAPGKELNVYMPSVDTKSDFKYWYFDKGKGQWQETGTRADLAKNTDIELKAKDLGVQNKNIAVNQNGTQSSGSANNIAARNETIETKNKAATTLPIKNSNAVLDISFNQNDYPELAPYNKFLWQFTNTTDPTQLATNNLIANKNWSNVQLVRQGNSFVYNVSTIVEGQPYTTQIQPVLTGKNAEMAKKLANAEANSKAITEQIETESNKSTKKEKATSELYNYFAVNKMGLYNCDRFYNDPRALTISPEFLFGGKKLAEQHAIYILTDNNKNVLQFNAASYQMKLKPEAISGVITVLGSGAIAVLNPESLTELQSKKEGGKLKMIFEKLKTKITNGKDLDAIL